MPLEPPVRRPTVPPARPDVTDPGRALPARGSATQEGPDRQRARVYQAEDAWAARLDAARRGAPLATVAGSAVLLPAERRLGSLETASDYLRRVTALPEVVTAVGALVAPVLRPRRGGRAAHWEPPGTIAVPVPSHGEPWALRESVLLHELAHHVGARTTEARWQANGHRPPFPALVLLLVDAALGPEASLALRVSYGEHRVTVGVETGVPA